MEIEELENRVRRLESDLHCSISKLVNEFRQETGYSPYDIDIDMLRITSIDSSHDQYMVEAVECCVDVRRIRL